MKSSTNTILGLTTLPAELTLLILSHLPLSTVSAVQRVNRYFSTFVEENESTVYRNAAWVEGWVPSPQTQLGELRVAEKETIEGEDEDDERGMCETLYSRRAMRGVRSWRDFCRKRKTISRAWSARAPSTILPSPRSKTAPLPLNVRNRSSYRRVHRIKIDEKAGLIMATSAVGGLVVRDLESDKVLWELPASYVPAYAHLEYERGYMLFNRDDGNTEIWQRTQDSSPSSLLTSYPDQRQLDMAERLSATIPRPCARAQFSPYALLVMPEPTRASRFVFPTLLASSLEKAFLWDVPTGECIQTLEGIQVVLPLIDFEIPQEEMGDQGIDEMDIDNNGNDDDIGDDYGNEAEAMLLLHANPTDISDGQLAEAAAADEMQPLEHFHNMMERSPMSSPGPDTDSDHQSSPPSDGGENDGDNDDDDDDDMLPRFLGLIRYVEVSERHVIIVGRYLLRVFSRATGKTILDIPSTHRRYGAARWEVASNTWAMSVGGGDMEGKGEKGKGKSRVDGYGPARKEGRELVRMPLKFTYEEWSRSPKLVIDQFMAAHLSRDGQHLVALLSGLRILIIPFFETLSSAQSSPPPASTTNTLPTPAASSTSSTTQAANDPRRPWEAFRAAREARRRLQREREQEVYARTLDVQLGAPRAASSVYLAYEDGRIGVVTTNAVYIVTPNISSQLTDTIPNLTVSRVPFFSNTSWLSAVSCLMMSDTGMYLNWNPAKSIEYMLPTGEVEVDPDDDGVHDETGERDVKGEGEGEYEGYQCIKWERDYQSELLAYENADAERYHTLPNGDMFVAREPRGGGHYLVLHVGFESFVLIHSVAFHSAYLCKEAVTQSHVSTVYTINFAPNDSERSTSTQAEVDSAGKEA